MTESPPRRTAPIFIAVFSVAAGVSEAYGHHVTIANFRRTRVIRSVMLLIGLLGLTCPGRAEEPIRIRSIHSSGNRSITLEFEDAAAGHRDHRVVYQSALPADGAWEQLPGARVTRSPAGVYSALVDMPLSGTCFFRILAPSPAPRVRKNVKDLSLEEMRDYVDANLRLKAALSPYFVGPAQYTYYDQFVAFHQLAVLESRRVNYGVAHRNPAFPPWHRKMLLLYEDALREVSGKNITIPYWDWTDPSSTAAVFTDDFMGRGGDRAQGYAVVSGPFRKGVWQINIFPSNPDQLQQSPHRYLVRGLGDFSANSYPVFLPNAVDVANLLRVPFYDVQPYGMLSDTRLSFRNALEGFVPPDLKTQTMHNVVHDWVAGIFTFEGQTYVGTMEPLDTSPNDPVFFLHHANVDRLWALWEEDHPDAYVPMSGEYYGWNVDDDMYPYREEPYRSDPRMTAHGITPGSMLDTRRLGYVYE